MMENTIIDKILYHIQDIAINVSIRLGHKYAYDTIQPTNQAQHNSLSTIKWPLMPNHHTSFLPGSVASLLHRAVATWMDLVNITMSQEGKLWRYSK